MLFGITLIHYMGNIHKDIELRTPIHTQYNIIIYIMYVRIMYISTYENV